MRAMFLAFLIVLVFSFNIHAVTATGWAGYCTSSCTVSATGGTPPYTYSVVSWYTPGLDDTNQCATINSSTGVLTFGDQWFNCRELIVRVTDSAGSPATDDATITRARILDATDKEIDEAAKFD